MKFCAVFVLILIFHRTSIEGQLNPPNTVLRVNTADCRSPAILQYIQAAVRHRDPPQAIMKYTQDLIQKGANVNAKDTHGMTALIYAAASGLDDVVQLLIDHGANINTPNNVGFTPLMAAAINGKGSTIKLLLQYNTINADAVDMNGRKASDHLRIENKGNREEILYLLAHPRELYKETVKNACKLYSDMAADAMKFNPRIVGFASIVENGEFPWVVALWFLNEKKLYNYVGCGGSIISHEFVVTAAHCVANEKQPIFVQLGKVSLSPYEEQKYNNHSYQYIREIIVHPMYDRINKTNDIALLRLARPILISHLIQPVCLQTDIADLDSSVRLTVAGWGQTNSGQTSNELLKTEVNTVPILKCKIDLVFFSRLTGGQLDKIDETKYCATGDFNDACRGDSGGPVQTNGNMVELLGVVSYGQNCGAGLPAIYTRVSYYIDWIGSHVWPHGQIKTP